MTKISQTAESVVIVTCLFATSNLCNTNNTSTI